MRQINRYNKQIHIDYIHDISSLQYNRPFLYGAYDVTQIPVHFLKGVYTLWNLQQHRTCTVWFTHQTFTNTYTICTDQWRKKPTEYFCCLKRHNTTENAKTNSGFLLDNMLSWSQCEGKIAHMWLSIITRHKELIMRSQYVVMHQHWWNRIKNEVRKATNQPLKPLGWLPNTNTQHGRDALGRFTSCTDRQTQLLSQYRHPHRLKNL